LGWL